MPAAVAPSAIARATSRPLATPPVAMMRLEAERRERRRRSPPWGCPSPRAPRRARARLVARAPRAASRRRPTTCRRRPRRRRAARPARGARARDRGRDAAARLLDDDRDAELAHEARDRLEAAAEIAIAAGLHDLHRGVQVDAERVGADRADERADLAPCVISRACTTPRLPSTSVGRRDVADAVRRRASRRRTMHRALAAEAEAVAALLGDRRELAVDARRPRSVPPVIAAMTIGARSFLPSTVHDVSIASRASSGSASWTRRTHSKQRGLARGSRRRPSRRARGGRPCGRLRWSSC